MRDPDPAKSTDTRKSSWEGPPRSSHRSHGSRQLPTQEGSFLSPGPQTLSLGGWTVGMTGVSPAPAIQRGQELQHHPEPKREPKGSHPPGAEESQGPGHPPRETGRGHTHTHAPQPHTHAQVCAHALTRLHMCSPTPTHTLPSTSLSLCSQGHCHQTASPLVPPQPCRGLRTTPWGGETCPSCSRGDPTLTPVGHGVTLRVQSQTKESLSQAWVGEHPGSSWAEAGGGEAQTWRIARPRRHRRNTAQPQRVLERTCRNTRHEKEK